MKKTIWLCFVLYSSFALASNSDSACEKKTTDYFSKHNTVTDIEFSNWTRMPEARPYEKVYRKRIKFESWVEAHINSNKSESKFYFIDNGQVKLVSVNSKCDIKSETLSLPVVNKFNNLDSTYFSNLDLKKIIDSGKKYVVYIFSPKMIYSLTEMKRAYKIAKKQNAEFISIFSYERKPDMQKIRSLAGSFDTSLQIKKQGSLDLFLMQAEDHFPSVFVINNKKMSNKKIQGVMPDKTWNQQIQKMFSEI